MMHKQDQKNHLFVIAGPTASGKTALAKQLIQSHRFEIVSADSRQVYRRLDIGTGKDKTLVQAMIDVVEPPKVRGQSLSTQKGLSSTSDTFSVAAYQSMALPIIDQIHQRGHIPLIVGGTGFYIDALMYERTYNHTRSSTLMRQEIERLSDVEILQEIERIDPLTSGTVDRKNRVRLVRALEIIRQTNAPLVPLRRVLRANLAVYIYVIDLPREELYANIDTRVDERLATGLVKEVEGLIASGISTEWLMSLGLEYRFVTQYLHQAMTYPEMVERLKYAIHDYARRQITYFKRWPEAKWLTSDVIKGQTLYEL